MDACFWESTLRCWIHLEMTSVVILVSGILRKKKPEQMNIGFHQPQLTIQDCGSVWSPLTPDFWPWPMHTCRCPTPLILYIENCKSWQGPLRSFGCRHFQHLSFSCQTFFLKNVILQAQCVKQINVEMLWLKDRVRRSYSFCWGDFAHAVPSD